jgi:hypothetical protein
VIPRGGYRVEDMVDDGIGKDGVDLDRAAAEARMGAIVSGRAYQDYGVEPSMEGWMHGIGARDPSNGMDSSSPTNRHLGARLELCCTSRE